MGERTTPSYVSFSDTERLVGTAAKNQAARNAENTIFDAKRLIGRKFSEPVVQADMKLWPFTVVRESADRPAIEVTYKGLICFIFFFIFFFHAKIFEFGRDFLFYFFTHDFAHGVKPNQTKKKCQK